MLFPGVLPQARVIVTCEVFHLLCGLLQLFAIKPLDARDFHRSEFDPQAARRTCRILQKSGAKLVIQQCPTHQPGALAVSHRVKISFLKVRLLNVSNA
jgi:hypothetical protein